MGVCFRPGSLNKGVCFWKSELENGVCFRKSELKSRICFWKLEFDVGACSARVAWALVPDCAEGSMFRHGRNGGHPKPGQRSPRNALQKKKEKKENRTPNKIAVVNWVFCQSFKVKPFWKYTNIQVLMTLKARKDFMVFKQRDFYCEVVYFSWLFVRSKLCLPLQRKTRSLCHCFVISGFSRKTNFAYK